MVTTLFCHFDFALLVTLAFRHCFKLIRFDVSKADVFHIHSFSLLFELTVVGSTPPDSLAGMVDFGATFVHDPCVATKTITIELDAHEKFYFK